MNGYLMFTENEFHKEYLYKGKLILRYTIKYPQFSFETKNSSVKKLNKYYYKKAMGTKKYCDRNLYQEALDLYLIYNKKGSGISMIEATVDFKVTYNEDGFLSIYFDRCEYTDDSFGTKMRSSDNWIVPEFKKIELKQLFRNKSVFSVQAVAKIAADIGKRVSSGEVFFENSHDLAEKKFDSENFYLTDDAVVIYYQQYVIAPFAGGIKEFVIPYNNELLDN